jgi:hypothetical protein
MRKSLPVPQCIPHCYGLLEPPTAPLSLQGRVLALEAFPNLAPPRMVHGLHTHAHKACLDVMPHAS